MPPALLPDTLRHQVVDANGIRIHTAEAGSGQAVLLLHGFPESWYSWRHQIAALAPYYRVLAPDLRGYGETEGRGPYDTDTLVGDVVALIDSTGERAVYVVGHDWGGMLAWLVAIHHPERVRTLTVCNAPHPLLLRRGLRRPRQLLRSWYMFFFQLPWLPERALAFHNYQALARAIIRDTRPGTFTRDDVRMMLSTWRAHGLGGGIDCYRALFRGRPEFPRSLPPLDVPVLGIWGEDDVALGRELNVGIEALAPWIELHYLPNVSHWAQQEAPVEVNALLLDFLGRHAA